MLMTTVNHGALKAVDDWILSASRGVYGCGPWRGFLKYLPLFRLGLAYEVGHGRRIKF